MINKKLKQLLKKARSHSTKVALVTGVFDILHEEHRKFLQKAKKEGDILIVGIESDARVRKLKGEGRPINNQEARSQKLEALGIADFVFILPEEFNKPEDHIQLISEIKPDVLAVSSHSSHLEQKKKIIEQFGGQLKIVHQHNPRVSSTMILEARNLNL